MVTLITAMILATLISTIIPTLAWALSMKKRVNREKSSPFECGFDPKKSARTPFSSRFFILAVLFLIFDIEIVLLLQVPIMPTSSSLNIIIIQEFLILLIIGLMHEWNEGSLDWTN